MAQALRFPITASGSEDEIPCLRFDFLTPPFGPVAVSLLPRNEIDDEFVEFDVGGTVEEELFLVIGMEVEEHQLAAKTEAPSDGA